METILNIVKCQNIIKDCNKQYQLCMGFINNYFFCYQNV